MSAAKMQSSIEEDLDRHLLRLLLGALAADQPHLVRLLPQHLADRQPEPVGLDKGGDESLDLRDAGAFGKRRERVASGFADLDLLEHPGELAGDRTLQGSGDLHDRGVKTLARLDTDRQHVEGVSQAETQLLLTFLPRVVDELIGSVTFAIDGEPAIPAVSIDSGANASVTVSLQGQVAPVGLTSLAKNVTATFASTNANFAASTSAAGSVTETLEAAKIDYTGDGLKLTSGTASNSTASVSLSAVVREEADGFLGSKLDTTRLPFSVYKYNSITPDYTCTSSTLTITAPGIANGSCSLTLGADNCTVKIDLLGNGHRATGMGYSLGGNKQFQVDVTDNGEPGASSSATPDTYAIRVWDSSGTYYQLGCPTAQVALNGGNIQVKP